MLRGVQKAPGDLGLGPGTVPICADRPSFRRNTVGAGAWCVLMYSYWVNDLLYGSERSSLLQRGPEASGRTSRRDLPTTKSQTGDPSMDIHTQRDRANGDGVLRES